MVVSLSYFLDAAVFAYVFFWFEFLCVYGNWIFVPEPSPKVKLKLVGNVVLKGSATLSTRWRC